MMLFILKITFVKICFPLIFIEKQPTNLYTCFIQFIFITQLFKTMRIKTLRVLCKAFVWLQINFMELCPFPKTINNSVSSFVISDLYIYNLITSVSIRDWDNLNMRV